MDVEHLAMIRANVSAFVARCARQYDADGRLLEIAPQVHEGAAPYFKKAGISTLDIDPASGATYIADLCACNHALVPNDWFDWVVCTEVLEHTLDPFAAAAEIYRVLKPGGRVFITTPFNFRIHGPLPDCWRFTEHGLRALLNRFVIESLEQIDTPGRDLMPIHYTVVAVKPLAAP
jgi:SAM-dependent methyltransferase